VLGDEGRRRCAPRKLLHRAITAGMLCRSTTWAMEPKICGAWNLHKVLKDRPEIPLVLFSSATGHFGAVMQGPYAAANAALDAFADHLHSEAAQSGVTSSCWSIGWSVWRETGISRGMSLTGQAPLRGYQMMAPNQALMSLSVATADPHPFVLVGLDPDGRTTRRYMAGPPRPTRTIVARINEPDAVDQIARVLAPIRLLDRYGTPTSCQVVAGAHTPAGPTEPQSDIERRIASVWRDILGQRKIQRDDDFFELGGTSLQMAQMHQLICQELGRDLRWADVLRTRTISAIAGLLDGPGTEAADTLTWQGIKYSYRYLTHRAAPQPIPLVLISGAFQGMYAMPRIEHLLKPLGNMIMADLPGPAPRTTCPATTVSTFSPTASTIFLTNSAFHASILSECPTAAPSPMNSRTAGPIASTAWHWSVLSPPSQPRHPHAARSVHASWSRDDSTALPITSLKRPCA
jgi:hypothetical protein